jgi:hypothetical protein
VPDRLGVAEEIRRRRMQRRSGRDECGGAVEMNAAEAARFDSLGGENRRRRGEV